MHLRGAQDECLEQLTTHQHLQQQHRIAEGGEGGGPQEEPDARQPVVAQMHL